MLCYFLDNSFAVYYYTFSSDSNSNDQLPFYWLSSTAKTFVPHLMPQLNIENAHVHVDKNMQSITDSISDPPFADIYFLLVFNWICLLLI